MAPKVDLVHSKMLKNMYCVYSFLYRLDRENEPRHEKTSNVVSEHVPHKHCKWLEARKDLESRRSVIFV